MNRIIVVASISAAFFCLAVSAGLSHYHAQPEGDLFYTPVTRCDPRIHSFSTGYGLTLIAASLVIFATSGAAMLAGLVPKVSKNKPRLKRFAGTAVATALVLLASTYLSPLFEANLPLHVPPECLQNAP